MLTIEKIKKYYLITIKSCAIIIKLTLVDQVTKWWMISQLKNYPGYTIEVTGFFNFVYSWNYGISFGLFSYYQYSNILFIILNSFILLLLFFLLYQVQSLKMFFGYSFIIGGAVGNLIDRITKGGVFDFIHLHYKSWHFPVFNLADSFITLGTVFLIVDYIDTARKLKEVQTS